MTAAATTPILAKDMARRTLAQRVPLVPASSREQALGAIAADVKELAKGFTFSAHDVRDALLAQQISASADVWGLAQKQNDSSRSALTLTSQQILARAASVASDLPADSLSSQAYAELPDVLRDAVDLSPGDASRERAAMRPS